MARRAFDADGSGRSPGGRGGAWGGLERHLDLPRLAEVRAELRLEFRRGEVKLGGGTGRGVRERDGEETGVEETSGGVVLI